MPDVCDKSDVCNITEDNNVKCTDKCEAKDPDCQNDGHCVIEDDEPVCR